MIGQHCKDQGDRRRQQGARRGLASLPSGELTLQALPPSLEMHLPNTTGETRERALLGTTGLVLVI